jgi:steroid delta-isomerase-like uncharacterized protein
MSVENNISIGRKFFEVVLSKGDWAEGDRLMTPDIVMHHPSSPEPIRGADAVKGFLSAFRAGFPDINLSVELAFADEKMVAVRWRARGTHTAPLFGIPPSGKSMNVVGTSIFHIENGKIVEDWVSEDTLGLMQQLGVIPAMG